MEYACVVLHSILTNKQTSRLESIQRGAVKLIFGNSEQVQSAMNELLSLAERRDELIVFDSLLELSSRLHHLLPPKRNYLVLFKLRHVKFYSGPFVLTERFKNLTNNYALHHLQ